LFNVSRSPAENSPAAIAKLDKYHLVILDDITYVSKDQAETSVLFELISGRSSSPPIKGLATGGKSSRTTP
jgi:DNA replication protein DnaC